MTQPDFTEEFICHATDRIKKGDYATSSYKRFFAGITQGTGTEKRIIGDTIGPFALRNRTRPEGFLRCLRGVPWLVWEP